MRGTKYSLAELRGLQSGLDRQRQHLAESGDVDVVDDVVDRLHELAGADGSAVDDELAHDLEVRLRPREERLAAAEHHRERTVLRAEGHPGDWAVGVGQPRALGPLRQPQRRAVVHGGSVDDGGRSAVPCHAAFAEEHLRRFRIGGHADEDQLRPVGQRRGVGRGGRALSGQRPHRLRQHVAHCERHSGPQEVAGHAQAHAAETDEADRSRVHGRAA